MYSKATGPHLVGSAGVERLRVALDATPLLGQTTGVGAFVAGAVPVLAGDPSLEVSAYSLSLRGGRALWGHLPLGVAAVGRPAPAAALFQAWARMDIPPGGWWTGAADVVHGTNFVVPPTGRAAAVVTVHDLTPLRYPELASPATRIFPAVLRRALRRGAWVHTPSAFVAGEVIEVFGAPPERVRAVHHGIPSEADVWAGADGRGIAGGEPPPMTGPYLLAVGTVEPRKGFPDLVRAFDALAGDHRGLRLVIAGPDGWGAEALTSAIARAAHGGRVVRLGYVSARRRTELLAGAAAFVFPSLYEGFGLPPLEAMAAGVPVVATTAGALPEVLGDAAMLVAPQDAEALAEALALVLGDSGFRGALVTRGRAQAARFSWAQCGAGLSALYQRAWAERG